MEIPPLPTPSFWNVAPTAQVAQDLLADRMVARIDPESEILVGLRRDAPVVLQHIRAHLVRQPDAAALMGLAGSPQRRSLPSRCRPKQSVIESRLAVAA